MKQQPMFAKFNKAVNDFVGLDINVKKFIKEQYEKIKVTFNDRMINDNVSLKKLSDFSYGTLIDFDNEINIDVAAISYFPRSGFKFANFIEELYNAFKYLPSDFKIEQTEGYIRLQTEINKVQINFRIILLVLKEQNKILKTYYTNRNGITQEDIAVNVTDDFTKANKLSSGILFSMKKLIKYVLKDDFDYSYNLDMIIMRWFYELVGRKIQTHLEQSIYVAEKRILNFDIEKFMKRNNLAVWIRKQINYKEIINYILSKMFKENTYYFPQFHFEAEEFFDQISRYSLNTNANFELPIDYFSDIKIFDLENFSHITVIQKHINNENGYSKISFDHSRANDEKFMVTPVMVSGIANFAMYKKWFSNKASMLFNELDKNLKSEISSTKQREGMEALNLIAHKWLSSYKTKIEYIKIYFDNKYPLHNHPEPHDLINLLIQTVDKLSEDDWLFEHDN